MVGNEQSGKTTYMSSAYGLLQTPIYGFTVRANDISTHSWLNHLYNGLRTHNLYPAPTDKRTAYEFNLLYQEQPIITFEWKDNRGGIINEKSIQIKEFIDDITNSDAVMMFFEGNALLNNISSRSRLRRICSLIVSNLEDINDDYYIIILITKYDCIDDVDFGEVIEPLADFIDMAEENEKIHIFTIPVACTKYELLHVDLPLLAILYGGIIKDYISKSSELKNAINQVELLQNSAWFGNDIYCWFTGEMSYGDQAEIKRQEAIAKYELLEKIEKASSQLRKFIENYELFEVKSKHSRDDIFSL